VSNLTKRFITGIIGVSIMLGAILWNEYSFSILFLFITVMAMNEFYKWCERNAIHPQKSIGITVGVLVFLFFSYFHGSVIPSKLFIIIVPLMFSIFIRELYMKSEHPFTNIAITILGVIYLAVPMGLMNIISQSGPENTPVNYHPKVIIGFLFLVWASDIGAYFAGKKFGRRKLFERISPNKTWEGSFGGTLSALAMAFIISNFFSDLRLVDWLVIAVIVVVTGTLGDLVESMFKRSIHIKDSGKVLPGHGGFLDRFDAVFISAPFVFTYLQLLP
jgi:phosphatidate cytidylyltransferase